MICDVIWSLLFLLKIGVFQQTVVRSYRIFENIFEVGKFKWKIKITMINVSCKNLLPKNCRDI